MEWRTASSGGGTKKHLLKPSALHGSMMVSGWRDLPVGHAEERVRTVEGARMNGWKVAVDFRPHSHHW